MKKVAAVALLFCIVGSCFASNDEPRQLKCTQLSKLNNSMTPVELFYGVSDCIAQDKYTDGVNMYMLLGSYGWFDTMRVTDKSAHQAVAVLKMYVGQQMAENKKQQWFNAVDSAMIEQNKRALCTQIRSIGAPSYYPDYMINHGLGGQQEPILSGFDAKSTWENTLKSYLKCK